MSESSESAAGCNTADAASFSILFAAHGAALRRYALRFVRSRDVADDLVQDVFSRLWLHWRRLDPAGNVRAYLYSATRRRVLDHLERRRIEERGLLRYTDPADGSDGPALLPEGEARVEADDVARAVERVLRGMPPRQRQAAALRLHDHLTTAEIAMRLGISPRTVEVHLARALRVLRAELPRLLGRLTRG